MFTWTYKGIIAYVTKLAVAHFVESYLTNDDSDENIVSSTASNIAAAASEIVKSISIQKRDDTPERLYLRTFEEVIRTSIKEVFVREDIDEIMSILSVVSIANYQNPDRRELKDAIWEALEFNGITEYNSNISDETIYYFIDKVSAKMQTKINESDTLINFVSYIIAQETQKTVVEIKQIVESTDSQVKDMNQVLNEILFKLHEQGGENKKLLEYIASIFIEYGFEFEKTKELSFSECVKKNKEVFEAKWKEPLFMQTKEERVLTLEDTYVCHEAGLYIKTNNEQDCDYNKMDTKINNAEEYVIKFVENTQYRANSMLITGVPGIGKTSLISYVIHNAKSIAPNSLIVLKFKDFSKSEIHEARDKNESALLYVIKKKLNIKNKNILDVLADKVLILDGFDELIQLGNNKELLAELVNEIKQKGMTKLIITSRDGSYINFEDVEIWQKLQLKYFSEAKVKEYYHKLTGKRISIAKEIDVNKGLGIPVLLYWAIVTGNDISSKDIEKTLYEKMFSLNGGFFDRYGSWEHSGYDSAQHPTSKYKKPYSVLLKKLAFFMFVNNKKRVSENEYMSLAVGIKYNNRYIFEKESSVFMDFPISYYGSGHEIEFIHSSLRDYFIADYLFSELKKYITQGEIKGEEIVEFVGRLIELFKDIDLSDEEEIKEFLRSKINNNIDGKKNFFVTLDMLLRNGTQAYLKERYTIEKEKNVFVNLFVLLRMWKYDKEFISLESKDKLTKYIRLLGKINLDNFNLEGLDLSGINFENCTLRNANLKTVDFSRTNMKYAELTGSTVWKADFTSADLTGAKLMCSDIVYAIFDRTKLIQIDLNGFNLSNLKLNLVDMSEAQLENTMLENAEFKNVNLHNANLKNTSLKNSKIVNSDFSDSDFEGANLEGVILERINLCHTNLKNTSLNKAKLDMDDISYANLSSSNLKCASMRSTILEDSNLKYANLQEADLKGANLKGADLQNTDFNGANLQSANLQGANLIKANLKMVNFKSANLKDANLQEADLRGADVQLADLEGCNLIGVDLREVKNYNEANIEKTITLGSVTDDEFDIKRKNIDSDDIISFVENKIISETSKGSNTIDKNKDLNLNSDGEFEIITQKEIEELSKRN
ncbi:MAG: pentapeptide repeat-containing protein [Lachnospiraceae bacterium]|nr:pentapeptide repeat-containing protein [Lachnospiraceae bacterium]